MSLLSNELTAVGEECRRGPTVRSSPSVDADGVSHISHPLPSTILAPRSSGVITQQSDDLPFLRLWPGYLHHDLVSNKTTVEDDDTSHCEDSDHSSRPYILELEGFVNFIRSAEFWPAVALAKLPGELIPIIVNFLLSAGPERSYLTQEKERLNFLSRTSLVCRSWWIIQRPKLFAKLELKSAEDVHFLLGMLRSPANQWLPAVIAEIRLWVHDASMDRYFNFLTRKLFNPWNLHISYSRVYSADRRSMGLSPHKYLLPSLRPFITSCHNVSHLTLRGLSFLSLSALSHALEGMSHLEELDLYQISCINTLERPPTRMSLASFPRLRRVKDHACTWMFLWLYAPFLARHCKRPPEEITFDNPYVRLLKHVIATFNAYSRESYEAVLIGAHTFQLKYMVTWESLLECVYEVQLWPSDSGAASAIRNVKVLCRRQYLDTDWNLVDSSFAEEAVALETMTFYFDHKGQTPKECFPKLYELGKLNFKREEQWDGLYNADLPDTIQTIPIPI